MSTDTQSVDLVSPPSINTAGMKRVVDKIQGLPTLSLLMTELLAIARNPLSSAKDMEEALRHDPSLTMKVMRMANSSFYGGSAINTLQDAIVLLGFPTIRSIILAASVFEAFPGTGRPGFSREDFWRHSLGVAVAARLLAIRSHFKDIEEAFIGGLIHDIGKVVLDEYASDVWQKVLTHAAQKKILLFEAEMEILGFSHAQIGQWLATKWKLPPQYTAAIFYHHQPSFSPPKENLPSIVHIADVLARTVKIGSGGDSLIPPLDPEAFKRSKIDEAVFQYVLTSLPEEFEKANKSFTPPGS